MDNEFDVLVIGGGIIGASAAHHTASAGYKTLLVEKGDYGSGTTSRTSRMHNCGFMYFVDAHNSLLDLLRHPFALLKSLELARRTMRERAAFVRSSPDRVRKVEFLIPLEPQRGITKSKMWIASTFLRLSGGYAVSLEPRFLGRAAANSAPLISMMSGSSEVHGAFRFAEYQYRWPERIVVDTIMKARDAGLDARNYTKVVALEHKRDRWVATLEQDGRQHNVFSNAIINAAGAWVDHVTNLVPTPGPFLNTGAKGVNLLIRLPQEARGFGMETVTSRGAPFYVMPWGDCHYVGPADSPADAEQTPFRATDAEIGQILSDANEMFPTLNLSAADVRYSWAGVRPRTAAEGKLLGSLDVREHDLSKRGLPNFFVFTGGLIMTHRDAGRRLLKLVRKHVRPSSAPKPIDYNLSAQPDENTLSRESVRRSIESEQARTLSDILRRRLSLGWDEDLALSSVRQAADLAGGILSWSEERKLAEIEAYVSEVESDFRPQSALVADYRTAKALRDTHA
ncbi:FAD-dependent oxidoreductase [Shinella zoogloeoides]|uniref:FAD-dependent oxidoreductase n=1 Tax=Shinella zoogloeoides TaxID=352475 RepID=UPI001F56BD1D|nr:FAD-dependent oxidoreductase [Shinella zoogloeoides]